MIEVGSDFKDAWKKYEQNTKNLDFLQSWEYGEFLINAGRKILRLKSEKSNEQCQAIIKKFARKYKFAYIPRAKFEKNFLQEILVYFRDKKFVFVTIEPISQVEIPNNFKSVPTRNKQPVCTWLLNLNEGSETILKKMHEKTRYNIRLAERKGIVVKNEINLDLFWNLNKETALRNSYNTVSKEYLKHFLDLNNTTQFIAYLDDQAIASALTYQYRDYLIYFFGASKSEGRNSMAPSLLQWHMIKYAISKGLRYYDFMGVAPKISSESSEALNFNGYSWSKIDQLSGVTRFKVGFGGFSKSYPQASNVIFKPILYYLITKFSKLTAKPILR